MLTLSAGDAPERYGDTNGEWYGSILNETFSIEAIRGAGGNPLPGRVRVKSLGFEQDFSGVTRIIANGGDGNDTFEVGPDVQAELVFDGGLGSDSFVVESPVGASRFTGGIGRGYDRLKVNGQFANFTLADSGLNLLLTPNGAPSNQARLSDIDTVYFVDQSVGANAPTGTRASSGPTVNGDIHLALRTYDNEELVTNLDLIRDDSEPYTRTNSQGEFYFDDVTLNDADRNSDGVTDWRDGMLVVGSPTNKDGGTTLSVTDSITGSNAGFPLVGLPGSNATVLTTLKYAGLLRWQPGLNVAGVDVTPEFINTLYAGILKDAPTTFVDDSFCEYVALGSSDPADVALGIEHLRFEYAHLVNVLTVSETFRQFKLDFDATAAWGYQPNPAGVDGLEIDAFIAYGDAIAARFGEQPLDPLGRPAVAAQFDTKDPIHVRAVLKEILAKYPTQQLFELEPSLTADFIDYTVRTSEQHARVEAAIEQHFGGFLNNLADGIVLEQQKLEQKIDESAALIDDVPEIGQQLFVPSVAGLKGQFEGDLTRELVSLASLPEAEYQAAFYDLFNKPREVYAAERATTGWIGVTVEDAAPEQPTSLTLSPDSDGQVRLRLDLHDAIGPLTAPDTGLAVRLRVGGTANGVDDYALSIGNELTVVKFEPGATTATIDVDVSAAAIADGSRTLQIEVLGADSGYRADPDVAVATIAFGAEGETDAGTLTGGRADFVPHQLVTREPGSSAIVQAAAGSDHVVLRGIDGEADLFVIGEQQASGVPYIENFKYTDDDGIHLAVGDLLESRRATWLADPERRATAITSLRVSLGDDVVDRLTSDRLDDFIAIQIEKSDPLPAFELSQIKTCDGIIFDVVGQRTLAYVSNYSATTGGSAWSISTSDETGIFSFGDITLSSVTIPENIAAGSDVASIVSTLPAGPFRSVELVAGYGDDDNSLFEIRHDESGASPQFYVITTSAREPLNRGAGEQYNFDYETNPQLSIRVRATTNGGSAYEKALAINLTDVNDAAVAAQPRITRVVRGQSSPLSWSADTLPVQDADFNEETLSVKLSVPEGTLAAESQNGVVVEGTPRDRVFSGTAAQLNDYFRSLDAVTYTSPESSSTEIGLDIVVLDGDLATRATADILVAELIQRPQLRRSTTLRIDTSQTGPQPIILSHAALAAAVINEPGTTTLVVTSVASGRVEKWDGRRWADISTPPSSSSPQALLRLLALRLVRPDDQIRWVPEAQLDQSTNAFALLGWDGGTASENESDVVFELPS